MLVLPINRNRDPVFLRIFLRSALTFIVVSLLLLGATPAQIITTVTPENPSGKDWLTIDIQNFERDVCITYQNLRLSRNQQVGKQSVQLMAQWESPEECPELALGSIVSFSVPPLYPGTYDVLHAECPYDSLRPICDDPIYERRGELEVSDPTGPEPYLITRTLAVCLTEPCPYYRVVEKGVDAGDTVLVAAVQDTSGLYGCPHCRNFMWWELGEVRVYGYFHEDSLDGWISRGAAFAITGAAGTTGLGRDELSREKLFRGNFPFRLSSRRGTVSIQFSAEVAVKNVKIYNQRGAEVHSGSAGAKSRFAVKVERAGVYLVEVQANDRIYRKMVAVVP